MLVAEDNPRDADLLGRALRQAGLPGPVRFVEDGHEAIEYLEGQGRYADRKTFPFPKVIISDLKMPRVNGLELLQWLSDHPQCCIVPTILLSSSTISADIKAAYTLGANTYFEKPISFDALLELIRSLKDYWLRSKLPPVDGDGT